MYSGITSGRVLDGELLYTKILEVHLPTDCFIEISLQSKGQYIICVGPIVQAPNGLSTLPNAYSMQTNIYISYWHELKHARKNIEI